MADLTCEALLYTTLYYIFKPWTLIAWASLTRSTTVYLVMFVVWLAHTIWQENLFKLCHLFFIQYFTCGFETKFTFCCKWKMSDCHAKFSVLLYIIKLLTIVYIGISSCINFLCECILVYNCIMFFMRCLTIYFCFLNFAFANVCLTSELIYRIHKM